MKVRNATPFGLTLSSDSARDIVQGAVHQPRTDADGVGLVVTPNIDHIATIRRSPALARAYRNAERIVCDGWPVQLYARYCGLRLGRVTGCEIAELLMQSAPFPAWQRLYFVVDGENTKRAVAQWADRNGVQSAVDIPPFGFELDAAYCHALAQRITDHGTTVLIMAVGAPRSEVFVDAYRSQLPPCWAFCVGQAVKIALGLVRRAPVGIRRSGLEWAWRIAQEPARLTSRYARASFGFGLAVMEDRFRQ